MSNPFTDNPIILPDKKIYDEFKNTFGTGLANYKDTLLMAITRKFEFDIFKFDEYCHKFLGYSEERHGSLSNFITEKYGKKANDLIKKLIHF